MMVKCLWRTVLFLLLVGIVWSVPAIAASDGETRLIGVIPITKVGISPALYRHADRLVPELKKLAPGKAVKLECRYNGVPSRERDVHKALMIAAEVGRYLHEIHKIRLNFWMTARFGTVTADDPAGLTFTLLADDITMLGRKPVVPVESDAE